MHLPMMNDTNTIVPKSVLLYLYLSLNLNKRLTISLAKLVPKNILYLSLDLKNYHIPKGVNRLQNSLFVLEFMYFEFTFLKIECKKSIYYYLQNETINFIDILIQLVVISEMHIVAQYIIQVLYYMDQYCRHVVEEDQIL